MEVFLILKDIDVVGVSDLRKILRAVRTLSNDPSESFNYTSKKVFQIGKALRGDCEV